MSTPGMLSEREASEVFGDYIDEDSQTVQHVSNVVHVVRSDGMK